MKKTLRYTIVLVLISQLVSCSISRKDKNFLSTIRSDYWKYVSKVNLSCSIDSIPQKKNWEFYAPADIAFSEETQYMHLPNYDTYLPDSFLVIGNCKKKWFEKDLQIKEVSFGKNDTILGTVNFSYNKNDLKSVLTSDGGYINGNTEYFIYDENRLIRIWYRKHTEESVDLITLYDYDSIGRPIKEVQWDIPDSNSRSTKTYQYFDRSPYPTKKEFISDGKSGTIEYFFDPVSNVKHQKSITQLGGERNTLYKYGEFDELIKQTFIEDSISTEYSYWFDERGNWIKRIKFNSKGEKHITTYRKIVYSKQ